MLRIIATICGLLLTGAAWTQTNFTANQRVDPYRGGFRSGVNFGYHHGWTDEQLAAIAIGDPKLDQAGAGINSLRLSLPDHFLEHYDYDIRKEAFEYYADLGSDENVLFIGFPSEENHDPTEYCPGVRSKAFKNMFTPIWDGGAHGTPINDDNAYAVYVYNLVKVYKDQVRFWEVMNEPDEDYSGNAWKGPEYEGNWFDNLPNPCDYKLRAPIQHYVRMLRITYEIVKRYDPEDYVAVGGLGSPGFLSLILRHTDNPDDGKASSDYPHYGGAWFDAMSYHVYPHIDGQMRHWSNEAGGFVYERHSDKAVDRVLEKKADFAEVLQDFGYDGRKYPEKIWLITETNVPRRGFRHHGSNAFQRNYLLKTAIMARKAGLAQVHWYQLGDLTKEAWAGSEFDVMGLYPALKYIEPMRAEPHDAAVANRTMTELMAGYRYDAALTEQLKLPAAVHGAAFHKEQAPPLFVLWARTKVNESEAAEYRYNFPNDLLEGRVPVYPWDYSTSGRTEEVASNKIPLTGVPVFIFGKDAEREVTPIKPLTQNAIRLQVFPNPNRGDFQIDYYLPDAHTAVIQLFDAIGRKVYDTQLNGQQEILSIDRTDLAPGLYLLQLETDSGLRLGKRVVIY